MNEKQEINETNNTYTADKSLDIEGNPTKLTLKQKILKLLDSKTFHYVIIGLVMLDLVIILAELLLTLYAAENRIEKNDIFHRAEHGLTIVSLFILCIFVSEILTKLVLVGPKYLFNAWHLLDAIVVIASFVLEVYVLAAPNPFDAAVDSNEGFGHGSHSSDGGHHKLVGLMRRSGNGSNGGDAKNAKNTTALLVIIRLWKFIRIIHAVAHSVEMKNRAVIERIKKEHNDCETKIKHYTDIIKNLSQQVEDNEKKIAELEHLVQHTGEYKNDNKN